MMRCPKFLCSSANETGACIECEISPGVRAYNHMTQRQAENVINTFCNGDFTKCNQYNGKITGNEGNTMTNLSEYELENIENEIADEIMLEENTEMNEYRDARRYHAEIVANIAVTETALLKICQSLKIIRDKGLYDALGYSSFGDYVENNGDYCFKERQAYTYISTYEKLGKEYIEEHAQAGITKLSLITQLSAYERSEALGNTDIAGLSTAEIKNIVEKYRKQGEQLSLLTEEKSTSENEVKRLKAELEAAKSEAEKIKENEANARIIAVNAARKQAVEETTKNIVQQSQAEALEHEKIIDDLKEKNAELQNKLAESQNLEPNQEIIEAAKKQAELEVEEKYKAEMEKLRADAKEAEKTAKEKLKAEKEKTKKAISQSNATESTVAFKFYFAEMQKNLKSFIETIEAVENEERKAGFKEAFKKYISMILDQL